MNIEKFKLHLQNVESLMFTLQNGDVVPAHFHVTELGMCTKSFMDCGGTIRSEKVATFQLWTADDLEHRLTPAKLINIIELAESNIGLENVNIELEYQVTIQSGNIAHTGSALQTIGVFGLDYSEGKFILVSKQTDCLAKDKCEVKNTENLVELACCSPNGGCC